MKREVSRLRNVDQQIKAQKRAANNGRANNYASEYLDGVERHNDFYDQVNTGLSQQMQSVFDQAGNVANNIKAEYEEINIASEGKMSIQEQLHELRNPSLNSLLGKENHLLRPEYNDYKYDSNYAELRSGDPNSMPPIDQQAIAEREEWLRSQEEQRRIQEIYAKNDSYTMGTVGGSIGFKYLGVSAWGSAEIGIVGETQLQPGWAAMQNYVDETGLSDDVKSALKGVVSFTAFTNGAGGFSEDTKIINFRSGSTNFANILAFSDYSSKSKFEFHSFGYNLDASLFYSFKHGQGFDNTLEALYALVGVGYDIALGPVTLSSTQPNQNNPEKKWLSVDYAIVPGGNSSKTMKTIGRFTKHGYSWNRTWTNADSIHILYDFSK